MTTFTGAISSLTAGTTTLSTPVNNHRDALKAVSEAWTAYTPTGTNFTVGDGTLSGRYARVDKLIHIRVNFAAGATTTYTASGMTLTLPVAAHATSEQALHLKVFTGSVIYVGNAALTAGATTCSLFIPTAAADCRLLGMSTATPNPGTTGNFQIQGTYEAA